MLLPFFRQEKTPHTPEKLSKHILYPIVGSFEEEIDFSDEFQTISFHGIEDARMKKQKMDHACKK
jgi:hypothetical protein